MVAPHSGPTRFDRFAETGSRFVSEAAFFIISLIVDRALHQKVDALARGLVTVMRHQVQTDSPAVQRSIDELASVVGLEQRV
jgi:hypothetical protein